MKKHDLEVALKQLQPFCAGRSTLPALSNVAITPQPEGRLAFQATNLEIAGTIFTDGQIDGDGTTTNLKRLRKVTGAFKAADLSLAVYNDDSLILTAPRRKVTLQGLPLSEFPSVSPPTLPIARLKALDIRRIGRLVVPSTATDEARPQLCAVYLELWPDELLAVGVDGYELAHLTLTEGYRPLCQAEDAGEEQPIKTFLVPSALFTAMNTMMTSGGRNGKKVTDQLATTFLTMTANDEGDIVGFGLEGQYAVIARLVDGEFPNWRVIFPKDRGNALTVDQRELAEALQSLRAFATNAVKMIWQAEAGGDQLNISMREADVGTMEATVSCTATGQVDFALALPRTLKLAQRLAPGLVTIDFPDRTGHRGEPALLISSTGDSEVAFLLQPMMNS